MSEPPENVCRWRPTTVEEWEDVWETDCGQRHQFFVDGPKENNCRFCCYCGKPLKEEEGA